MANASRTIRVKFDGSTTGLAAAVKQAERDLARFQRQQAAQLREQDRAQAQAEASHAKFVAKLGNARDGVIKLGAISGLVTAVGGLGGAGVAGGIAAVGALGAALGVTKLAFSGVGDAVDAFDKGLESGDLSEYNKLLAKMPPAQREFTKQLVATKQEFGKLKATAAAATLPGFTKAVKDSTALLPVLDSAVARTGKILSGTASKAGDLFKSSVFQKDLDGFLRATEPVTKAIGDSFVDLTGRVVKFGREMAPAAQGFATFVGGLSKGISGFLDGLAPHADSFKSIWESLGSVAESVGPILGGLIGDLADSFAPILRDVAGWLRENKDEISKWAGVLAAAAPWLVGLAAALKGLKIANEVRGWVSGIAGLLDNIGTKADGAATKVGKGGKGGLVGALGGLKALAAAGGVAIIATELDKANVAAAGGAENLSGWDEQLHDFVGMGQQIASGDFGGIFSDIGDEWNDMVRQFETGESPIGKLFGNDQQNAIQHGLAQSLAQVSEFATSTAATIGNIRAVLQITGDVGPAINATTNAVTFANGQTGTVTVAANGQPAMITVGGVKYNVDSTTGVMSLAANQNPALGTLAGAKATIDRTTGRVIIDANDGPARAKIAALVSTASRTVTMTINAIGNNLFNPAGRARGGPIYGPGSGTSDTAGLFRLSNGEHVLTAAEVRAAGGHGAVLRMRQALLGGRSVPGLAGGGPVPSWMSSPAAQSLRPAGGDGAFAPGGGDTHVTVLIDGQQFRGMIRTEIDRSDRDTRRSVYAGAGSAVA